MKDTTVAASIKKTYMILRAIPATGGWVPLSHIAIVLDMPPAEFIAGVKWLMYNDEACEIMPESNRKILKEIDHKYAVPFAGDDNHLITWL